MKNAIRDLLTLTGATVFKLGSSSSFLKTKEKQNSCPLRQKIKCIRRGSGEVGDKNMENCQKIPPPPPHGIKIKTKYGAVRCPKIGQWIYNLLSNHVRDQNSLMLHNYR